MNVVFVLSTCGCMLAGGLLTAVFGEVEETGVVRNVDIYEAFGRCWTNVKFDVNGEVVDLNV